MLPPRIGKYEIRAEIGEGQFGRVLRGFDPDLHREVAIKVPRAGLTVDSREEFLREARAAAQIKHQFVCEIYEVGLQGVVPYIVMPFIENGTLANRLARTPLLPAPEVLTIVRNVALGLHAAHRKGIVHRDLKPGNILFDEAEERVLITDFGLAKLTDSTMTVSVGGSPVVKGTPLYMSPEQWRPDPRNPVGPLSDIYSLGVILFQLLTGIPPFVSPDGNIFTLGFMVCADTARAPSTVRPGLDEALDDVCLKALEKAPGNRYGSAKAFADAIGEYLQRVESVTPPASPAEFRAQAEAACQRGKDYYFGRGVPQDYAQARQWFEKAAIQGDAEAQSYLGALYHRGWGVLRDDAKAREWYEKAAAQGHSIAQYNLGALYDNGWGGLQDYDMARRWYEKAAAQGLDEAQNNLGGMYNDGRGIPQDYTKAREWYEKAAAKGHAEAQYKLGALYDNGHGVPQDYTKAREWYEKAAAKGHADAQANLGWLYERGDGVPEDYAIARHWYEKAAEQGHAAAKNDLGGLYERGDGVPQDYAIARRWYEEAAEQGLADAQYNLGLLYDNGLGVPQDYAIARWWYEKAAAQGHAVAQLKIAEHYENGKGVVKDSARAIELYRQAAKQGNAWAKRALRRLGQSE